MEALNQKSSREAGRNRGNNHGNRQNFDGERRVRGFDARSGGNSGNFAHNVFAMLDEDEGDLDIE